MLGAIPIDCWNLRGQTSGSHPRGDCGLTQRSLRDCAKVAVCLRIADDHVVVFRGLQNGLPQAGQTGPDGV